MLAALRQATAERHALLDSSLAIGSEGATLAHYREHLCMLHAWLLPLERWQGAFADGPQGARTLPSRRLSERIEADLTDPAMPSGSLCEGRQNPWPANASPAYRWGVSYVIEGSQLGGAVLYQRLAARLAPHPLRYLRGEVQGPGPRWRSFMQELRGAVHTPGEIAQACAGACDAFDRILALREQAATPAPD
ncbi:biliverdin-producing heme oxygenase [Massilia sp. CF038]|uniref:biliverdin-producing heme oxygenase n=1 Tax=Massilia sp. CF038 TaxID=1881045 RepID=UPI0009182032|nr:biliverdin-producing heme oxygenase [Massilia sp. CF038]SHG45304.1 Heme oxygenase [Massilia sp. CF038]